MSADPLQCAALTGAGDRCKGKAVAETDWWRCHRHVDWYTTATQAQIERLAWLEIEEAWINAR